MDDKKANEASLADGVIAELREGGELHSEGRFTMDRETAREKLGDFQLPDAHWSLLMLVRAAVRRGAGSVDVDVDTDDIRLAFDGPVFDEHDFEDLYHDPLSDRAGERHAGRQELAIGLNAAQGMEPRYIRVVSGDAELELRPGKADRFGPAKASASGTTVHIKLRKNLALRAMASYGEVLPEVELLKLYCPYAEIPVTVNGERISHGLAPSDAVVWASIEAEGMTCTAGVLPHNSDPLNVRVVKHGVWIAELKHMDVPPDVAVVVRADGIRTDLTQFGLVEDQAYEAMLEVVERGSRAVLRKVAERIGGEAPARKLLRAGARGTLRQGLWRFSNRHCFKGTDADPLAEILSALPLYSTLLTGADGGGHRSLAWLMQTAERSEIVYLREDHDVLSEGQLSQVLPRLDVPCLVVESGEDAKLLKSLLDPQLVYITNHPIGTEIQAATERKPSAATDEASELDSQAIWSWAKSFAFLIIFGAAVAVFFDYCPVV